MHGITWAEVRKSDAWEDDATTLVGDAWHSGQYASGVWVTIHAATPWAPTWSVALDCDWTAPSMSVPTCGVAVIAACALAQYEMENFSAPDEGE